METGTNVATLLKIKDFETFCILQLDLHIVLSPKSCVRKLPYHAHAPSDCFDLTHLILMVKILMNECEWTP